MALIKCNECGKEMSNKADFCPNCGAENSIMVCPECGKQISRKASLCPNCGYTFKKSNDSQDDKINGLCLGGMITGIVSFLIDFFGLVSATGLIISIIGLCKSTKGKNRTFAIVGIVTSSIELFVKVIQLINLISLSY